MKTTPRGSTSTRSPLFDAGPEAPNSAPDRRTVLKGGSAGLAAAGLIGLSPSASAALPLSKKQQFLLDRITFGRTDFMALKLRQLGWTGFLDWQLDYAAIDDSAADAAVLAENADAATLWGYDPVDVALDPNFNQFPGAVVQGQAPQIPILYGHHSQRQLLWVMTDFMQNVHNTYLPQPLQYLFWSSFLRDTVHAHCLGSYEELVKKSGQGGSMLWYLQQWLSCAAQPIENYARELLELYTVGVTPHFGIPTFGEDDMLETARALTGWTLDTNGGPPQNPNPNFGKFTFDGSPEKHAAGDKFVPFLGKTYLFDNVTPSEGELLMKDLVQHPLTALNITFRLIQWLIGDDVTGRYYNAWVRSATVFNQTGGDMKATVRELFDESHFDEIAIAPAEKVRRPLNLVVALKRATNATITTQSWEWLSQLYKMGQVSGWWAAPNGHPPQNDKWTGSMQARIEFLYRTLIDNETDDNGLVIADAALDAIFPSAIPLSEYASRANKHVFGDCLPPAEEAEIDDFLMNSLGANDDPRKWALFLTMAAPSYQYFC